MNYNLASGSLAYLKKQTFQRRASSTWQLWFTGCSYFDVAGFEGPEPRERDHLEPYLIELPESTDGETHDSLQKQDHWVRWGRIWEIINEIGNIILILLTWLGKIMDNHSGFGSDQTHIVLYFASWTIHHDSRLDFFGVESVTPGHIIINLVQEVGLAFWVFQKVVLTQQSPSKNPFQTNDVWI